MGLEKQSPAQVPAMLRAGRVVEYFILRLRNRVPFGPCAEYRPFEELYPRTDRSGQLLRVIAHISLLCY